MTESVDAVARELAVACLGGDPGAARPLAEAVLSLGRGAAFRAPQCLARPEDYFDALRAASLKPRSVGAMHGWLQARREANGFLDWRRSELLCLRGLLAGWLPRNRPKEGTDLWETLSADLMSLWRRWEQGLSPSASAWLAESLFCTVAEAAALGRQRCLEDLGHAGLLELERVMIDHHAEWGQP